MSKAKANEGYFWAVISKSWAGPQDDNTNVTNPSVFLRSIRLNVPCSSKTAIEKVVLPTEFDSIDSCSTTFPNSEFSCSAQRFLLHSRPTSADNADAAPQLKIRCPPSASHPTFQEVLRTEMGCCLQVAACRLELGGEAI